jgi:hypothetical protein
MDSSSVLSWALTALVAVVQATMVYGFARLLYIGGGFQFPNPFQKGWSSLHAAYGTTEALPPLQTTSARIGMVSYKDVIDIGFGEAALFLRKRFWGEQTVRIPYADIILLRPPGRNTVLRIPVRTDGLFVVQGVRLLIRWNVAEQLVARLAAPAQQS